MDCLSRLPQEIRSAMCVDDNISDSIVFPDMKNQTWTPDVDEIRSYMQSSLTSSQAKAEQSTAYTPDTDRYVPKGRGTSLTYNATPIAELKVNCAKAVFETVAKKETKSKILPSDSRVSALKRNRSHI